MGVTFEILMLQFEQPDKAVWEAISHFAEKWNRTKENKFVKDESAELAIYFADENHYELKELENILEQKHREAGWAWIKTIPNDPTKEAIEGHDYIQIIGDGYPDEFLLNELDALSPELPCETCGTIHTHLRKQKKALQINEAFLTGNGKPNDNYTPKGLDIINVQHGALLVSKKIVQLIQNNKKWIGCTFLDVYNQHGKVSQKLFQLVADKVILLPDNLMEQGSICATCGTVISALTQGFRIKMERLGDAVFFSRIPSGISLIYISNALYHHLKSENSRGLTPVQGADLIND